MKYIHQIDSMDSLRLHPAVTKQPSLKMEELAVLDRSREPVQYTESWPRKKGSLREAGQQLTQHRAGQGGGEGVSRAGPNHKGCFPGEQEMRPSDIISQKQKVDENMHYDDITNNNNSIGLGPSNMVTGYQVAKQHYQYQSQPQQQLQLTQPPALQQQPQPRPAFCRALYEFDPKELNLEDCKDCLSFLKGDVLTVIRPLDESWIEGKLGDKVGIFPLQFTEPDLAAARLLEGSSQRGSGWAEPRPRSGGRKNGDAPSWTAIPGAPQGPPIKSSGAHTLAPPPQGRPPPSAQTTQAPHASVPDGSNQPPPGQHSQALGQHSQFLDQPARLSGPPALRGSVRPSRETSQHVRRRFNSSGRHLSQGERKMNPEAPATVSMALVSPQTSSSSSDAKSQSSTQQLSISVCAVLYSYKPRRPEELELRKGEMVGVYGQFKEGWLRGLSLRTGKVGVLPGNFITPVLRTSARLLETKAGSASSGTVTGKRKSGSRAPAVVLALDRGSLGGATYSSGQVPSAAMGTQPVMSSAGAGRSLYGVSQGWDALRQAVDGSHRDSGQRGNSVSYTSSSGLQSHSQSLAHLQAPGYSPALPRNKHPGRPLGRRSEATAPSAGAHLNNTDTAAPDAAYGPQSILVRPDAQKSHTDKPTKSVRFLTQEDSPPLVARTTSQATLPGRPGLPPTEVWAPCRTFGRDGPGVVLRKGLDTADQPTSIQKPASALSLSAAVTSTSSSPIRHRVAWSYQAQTDSELSLAPGDWVLVHRHRPDGRVLLTQEGSGHTGLFQSGVLHVLERVS